MLVIFMNITVTPNNSQQMCPKNKNAPATAEFQTKSLMDGQTDRQKQH